MFHSCRSTAFLLLTLFASTGRAQDTPPDPLREFRGSWIASVANIDWPSTNTLSTDQQQAELSALLDKAAALKLNAIILQIRPACDALYASKLEPWSEYLTGEMGKSPAPLYDPLQFAIEQAHRRGLELHAWFNPYRARHRSAKSPISANHISRTHPSLVKKYGEYLWLDPAEPAVQKHSLAVVMDVVRRYDVDGIHFDDYFYPYKERLNGKELDFPDDASWNRLGSSSGLSRDDWRRKNVNEFLKDTYSQIKSTKPWVKFGISPFGLWRPGYPPQVTGLDAYDKLYADSRKWLNEGTFDYFAPQLYWSITSTGQSFPVLLNWWRGENKKDRHLWPGLNTSSVGPRGWAPEEIEKQIALTRAGTKQPGHIHWNISALVRRPELRQALSAGEYTQPALIPASPWLGKQKPAKPALALGTSSTDKRIIVSWKNTAKTAPALWVLQTRLGSKWDTLILPGSANSRTFTGIQPDRIALRAVDRYGNLSAPAIVRNGAAK